MRESRDSKREASLKRDFSVDKEDRRSFRGKLACLRHTFGKFQWPSRGAMTTERRLAVMARVHVCAWCVCVCVCSYDVRFDPLPRATSLTRLRPCTNFTLGTYGFPVLASCFLSGHRQQQPTTARCCSSRLPRPVSPSSSHLLLAHVSVSLSFHILAVAHTWRAYACIRVCARPLARHCLTLPSFSLFRGICTVSHKRFGGRVQIFFYSLSLRFPCISQFLLYLLSFFPLYYYLNFEILI